MNTKLERKFTPKKTIEVENKATPSKAGIYFLLITFAILCLYPVLWLLINSFKSNTQLFANPWNLPGKPDLSNYINAWKIGNVGTYFINSCIVTITACAITVFLGSTTAYAISRMRWRLSKYVMGLFLIGIMIPTHSLLIPLFSMFQKVRITNTFLALILPYVGTSMPMTIFILTGFFGSLPRELEEASVIDGCSLPKLFIKVIMPISIPGVVTVAVYTFIQIWNDLLFALVFMTDNNKMTLPVGLTNFVGLHSTDYTGMIAAIVVTVVPSILVYIFMHDKIIAGMTAGAVKG